MAITFTKATRKRSKARVCVTGPAGAGKSYSALLIARGIGGKIAAIDTENGSLSLYAGLVPFDVLELVPPFTPERYIEAMEAAETAGYDTIVIDSLSHEWIGKGGILEIHDAMPGNSFANWNKLTPRHQRLIDAIVSSPCHVVATMRSKSEYLQTEDGGKKKVEKVGTAPQQREGMDFEFTICLDVQQKNHVASASKDRSGLWDQRYEVIAESHGRELKAWLEQGGDEETPKPEVKTENAELQKQSPKAEPPQEPKQDPKPQSKTGAQIAAELKEIRDAAIKQGARTSKDFGDLMKIWVCRSVPNATELSAEEREKALAMARSASDGKEK